MGLTSWKLSSLKKKAIKLITARRDGQASDSEVKKEIDIYFDMAQVYDKHLFDKSFPQAKALAMECYRAAANLGSIEAMHTVGDRLLEEAKFWDETRKSFLGSNIHEKYARRCYEEAMVYLNKADEHSHPESKRLLGLIYINGWGVEKDEDKGFKLVVASIELEDAWDRATDIFKDIGLNKPEFFSSIMSMRQQKSE